MDKLLKRFSIGFAPVSIGFLDLNMFLKKYHPYLRDMYFSLKLNDVRFQTRQSIVTSQIDNKAYFNCLNLIRSYGVGLKLALNSFKTTTEMSIDALKEFISESGIVPDSIVCLKDVGELAKNICPDSEIIYSYNNGVRTFSDIEEIPDVFNTVVIGNSGIRNFKLFSYAKQKGFQTEHLLNNGCQFDCKFCGEQKDKSCKDLFMDKLRNKKIEELYALQSIFPSEFHEHLLPNKDIDFYKISSRPSSPTNLNYMMDSYINNNETYYLTNNDGFIKNNVEVWKLWGRLVVFNECYFSYEKIIEIKKRIWEKLEK